MSEIRQRMEGCLMSICMKCGRDYYDSSEGARFSFENQSMTISGILCERCGKELLDWLLKEDED